MNNIAIITARMTSNRLPGKILLNNKHSNMIGFLIARLSKSKLIDDIVVSTTTNNSDDVLVNYLKKINIKYFRGSENNVFERVFETSDTFKSNNITFITGDCPLIDYQIVDQCIRIFNHNDCDYVTNAHIRSYPDGMDAHIISAEALKNSYTGVIDELEKEHVTLNLRRNSQRFKTIHLIAPDELNLPNLGLTLDEKQDYILINEIINNLYFKNQYFNCEDIVKLLHKNPKLMDINSKVIRKGDN